MSDRAQPLRVLLVEDHATVRGDGASAIELARALRPDVVVMDVAMPGVNGLEATRAIKAVDDSPAIVTLTRYNDDAYVQELLRAGTSAYVLKQTSSSELLQAIRAAAAGRQYLDSAITRGLTSSLVGRGARRAGSSISEREAEVLKLIAWGHSNKEIAAQLDLSVKTIEVHKANAMRKLDLHGRIDIVRYALLQGWLKEE
jgi:DNA-binding NarL/FixJ family response regulator